MPDAGSEQARLPRNRAKQQFEQGGISLGGWATLSDPQLIEIIGQCGYDVVGINLEHASFGLDVVRQMIMAAEIAGVTPVVRVRSGEWGLAVQVLDMGAQGIQVSHVSDVQSARDAVHAIRFAPLGERAAYPGSRATRFGQIRWPDYKRYANEETLLIVMLEDREAIRHVEEISAIEGIDVVMVGAADLADSLGLEANDPDLRAAVEDVATRIQSVGNAVMGFPLGHAFLKLSVQDLRDLGIRYVHVSPAPVGMMRNAMNEAVTKIRSEWAQSA